MKRLILVTFVAAFVVTRADAQQRPALLSPHVDLEVPAGAVTLEIRRDLQPKPVPGLLGTRWALVVAGFGDPISLEGRPVAATKSTDYVDTIDNRKRLTSRRDRRGNSITLTYDNQGRITRLDGPKAVSLAFTLDRAGKLTAIRSTRGDVAYALTGGELTDVRVNSGPPLRYTYAPAGPSRIDHPLDGTIDVTYDTAGRVSEYRWADGSSMRFSFDNATRLDTVVDQSGGTTTIQERGGVVEVVDAAGQRWTSEWDAVRRTRIDTAPDRSVTRTTLDEGNRPVTVIDPIGRSTSYQYTTRGDVAAIVLPGGARRTFEYDASGWLTAERLDGQLIRSFAYSADGLLTVARGLNWPERRYTHDANGFVRSVATAGRGTVTFDRDARGNVTRMTTALGGVVTRTFDAQDRLISETSPIGATERWRYDDRGRVVEYVDGAGAATRLEYDGRGRVTQQTDAAGVTSYEYNAAGLVTRITTPGESPISYAYDAGGQLVRESGPTGDRVFEHDVLGRLVRARDTDGRDVSYTYNAASDVAGRNDAFYGRATIELDPAGRVARVAMGASGTQYQYDPIGRLRAVIDPLGHERHMTFGADGAPASSRTAGGDEAFFGYDLDGLLTSIKRASGGTERFEYDAAGNVKTIVSPNGGRQSLTYDTAGRLTSSTDALGQTIKYSWDALNRLTARELPDGSKHALIYDAAGRVTQTADARHTMRYAYDAAGRMTSAEFGTAKKTVRSEYGTNGLRSRLIDGDGKATSYTYSASGQVSAIQMANGSRIAISYDGVGRMRSVTLPNGLVGTWQYDDSGRPTRVAYADAAGRALVVDERRYDAASNVIERRNEQGRVTRLGYDSADQLTEESLPNATTRFTYGPGGNRISLESPSAVTNYQYDAADQLVNVETTTRPAGRTAQPVRTTTGYAFDPRGVLQRRGTSSLTFDPLLRLIGAPAIDGSAPVTFEYAVTGERLVRRDRNGVTHFIYDGLDLLQEVDASGRTLASFVHGPGVDQPLAMEKGGQWYYFLADLGGSIVAIADARGRVVSTFDYDAFGVTRAKNETVSSPFGFSGRELDAATGLYYFRARYYDPTLGRFLSTDPLAPVADEPLSFNPYIYVLNNPGRFSDPTGLAPTDPLPPDWGTRAGALQSALQNGVPVPRGGLAAANFDDSALINAPINLNELFGQDEVTLRGVPRAAPGNRDSKFRKPLNEIFVNERPKNYKFPQGPGLRDRYRFRPPVDSTFGPARPPSAERTISELLKKMPDKPVVDPPVRPAGRQPWGADQVIADALKTPPRPSSPTPPEPPGPRTPSGSTPVPSGQTGNASGPTTPSGPTNPSNPSGPTTPNAQPGSTTSGAPSTPGGGVSTPGAPSAPGGQPSNPPSGGVRPGSGTNAGPGTVPGGGTGTGGGTPGSPTLRDPMVQPRNPADGNTQTGSKPDQPAKPTAPRGLTTLTIVMTSAQVVQCYKAGHPFEACVRLAITNGLIRQAGLMAVGATITVVATALGGPPFAVAVVTAVSQLGGAAGAIGATEFAINEITAEYSTFTTAAAAMDEVDAAVAGRIDQLRLRLQRMTKQRDTVAQTNVEDRLTTRRIATQLTELRSSVDDLQQQIGEMERSGGANACEAASTLQRQLATYRTAGADELRQIETEVRDMRNRLASCRTAADSEAIRMAWARNAQRADVIDAAVQAATAVRAKLMDEVARLEPGQRASDADSLRTTIALLRARLREVEADALRSDGSATTKALNDYRAGIAAIRSELVDVRASTKYERTYKEWIIETLRPWSIDLDARFTAFEREIDAEASRMGDAGSTLQANEERDKVYNDASQLVRRVDTLAARLNASGCSFTDDASILDDLRRRQGDARALLEQSDQVFSQSDRCTSGTRPVVPDLTDPPNRPSDPPTPPRPRVFSASLECGTELRIASGGRSETCGVRVSGWRSDTRTPVEIIIEPPFTAASGLSASPGNTAMGGDVIYASGVSDRAGEYTFHQGFSAARGTRTGATTIVVIVRQGDDELRLPLTLRVLPNDSIATGGPPIGPNTNRNPPNPNGTPANLRADLECGGRLEIEAGGMSEPCGVIVRNWRSNTTTPVEIIFDPPFERSSGVRVAPGDTSQGGDTMYASGVNNRFNEYVFGEGFSAERGAATSSTTFTVIVRQGNAEVRLPMTLNVVPIGTPRDSSFEPPTPNVTGSGGPYCVWQYRMFNDLPGCWNAVAAGCTEPRYLNRPEYIMVGNNMTRGEADKRIGEISQFFDRVNCVPEEERKRRAEEERKKREAEEDKERERQREEREEAERRRRADEERKKREAEEEKERNRPTGPQLSQFGIDPRDVVMKVGEARVFRAWGVYTGTPGAVIEVPVKWSGDIAPNFQARPEHAGRNFRLTATAPDGSVDSILVRVEANTTAGPTGGGTGGGTTGGGSTGGTGGPAPPGSVHKTKVDVAKDLSGRYGYTKNTDTSAHRHDEEGPNNVQDYRCSFSGVPGSLAPGQVYTIGATASYSSNPPTWYQTFEAIVHVGGGIEYAGDQIPAFATIEPGSKRPPMAGTFKVRLRPGATSGAIALSCYPGGTVATHHYGVK